MYTITFSNLSDHIFTRNNSIRSLITRIGQKTNEYLNFSNEYNFSKTHWDFYANQITTEMLLMLIKEGCFKNEYNAISLRLSEYSNNRFESVTNSDHLNIDICEYDLINEEATEEYFNTISDEVYDDYAEIFKDTENQFIKIGKTYTNRYAAITSTVTYDFIFKIILLVLEKEPKVLDTPEKEEVYKSITDFFKACVTKNEKDANKALGTLSNTFKRWDIEKCKALFQYDAKQIKEGLKREKRDMEQRVNSLMQQICSYYKKLEDLSLKYAAAKDITEEQLNEILDYLDKTPYLTILNNYETTEDGDILLRIDAPLIYYDEDFLETLIERQDYTPEWNLAGYTLFDKVFLQRKYELWTYATLRLNMSTFATSPCTGLRFEDANPHEYYPHPHIMEFFCQGNHTTEIQKWIQNRDYIGCFEQIISMAMNLNFTDSTVIEKLYENLTDSDLAEVVCFKDKATGIFYSFQEIYEHTREEL